MTTMLPWIEKYRPKKVADIAHQEQVVKTLGAALQSGNIPHLLFYGPPGTGKTSTALALARQLFGEYYKERTLELNASDERGISVVREKIKKFASRSVADRIITGQPVAPFKLIILDEADSMTKDAQSALRRTMEVYTNVTRFCLVCNYVSRIIEPIASRCAKFRFQPLSQKAMVQRFEFICEKEGVSYEHEALESLVKHSEGDMRKAITLLQSAAEYSDRSLTAALVAEISGVIPTRYFDKLQTILHEKNFKEVQLYCDEITYEGYAVDNFFSQVLDTLLKDDSLSDQKKALAAMKLAEAGRKLQDGGRPPLQLLSLLSEVFTIYKQDKVDVAALN